MIVLSEANHNTNEPRWTLDYLFNLGIDFLVRIDHDPFLRDVHGNDLFLMFRPTHLQDLDSVLPGVLPPNIVDYNDTIS